MEKAFDKFQYPFMITMFQESDIKGTYLNIIKALCDKPAAIVIFNGKKIESISPKLRNKTRVSTLMTTIQLLFNIVLEVLTTAIRKEKKKKKKKN